MPINAEGGTEGTVAWPPHMMGPPFAYELSSDGICEAITRLDQANMEQFCNIPAHVHIHANPQPYDYVVEMIEGQSGHNLDIVFLGHATGAMTIIIACGHLEDGSTPKWVAISLAWSRASRWLPHISLLGLTMRRMAALLNKVLHGLGSMCMYVTTYVTCSSSVLCADNVHWPVTLLTTYINSRYLTSPRCIG